MGGKWEDLTIVREEIEDIEGNWCDYWLVDRKGNWNGKLNLRYWGGY